MQTTSKLELKKPSDDDFIDIEDLNYNAQKLDEKVKEIVENIEGLSGLKDSIQLTTDREFVNSLINNTAKAGSVLLFSNIGERNGNVTGESYTLYAALANCNQYSGCDITVKTLGAVAEQNLHPMYFQVPAYYIAKVDKQNAKKVVISPLESGKGDIDVLQERIDSVEERANQAFTQAGEGKKAIVNAFTGLGISASSSETFKSLADKIKNKTLSKERVANALTNKGVPTDTNATQQQIIQNITNFSVPTFIDFSTKTKNDFITNYSGDLRRYSDKRTVIVDGSYTTTRQYGMYKIPHNFSGSEKYLVLVDPSVANSNGRTLMAAFYPYITNDTHFLTGTPVSSLKLTPLTSLVRPKEYSYDSYGAAIVYKIPNGITGNYYFVFANTYDSNDYYIFDAAMQGILII